MNDRACPAAGTSSNVVIRASAGTGKTYQLTNRYIQLLFDGVPPEQIVASTFTRKAAGEILERVLLRLALAVQEPGALRELSAAVDRPITVERAQQLLDELVSHLHRVRITTLDSFFSRIGHSAALEVGLPLGWTILDEHQDEQFKRLALGELLNSENPADLERLVLLINQGGADRPVAARLERIISELYPIYQDSPRSAWDMPIVGRRMSHKELAKVHETLEQSKSTSDKRLQEALTKDLERLEKEQWETMVETGLLAAVLRGQTTYYRKELPKPILRAYLQLADHVRARLTEQWRAQTMATYELLERFDHHYRQCIYRSHAVGFDDITLCLARNLSENKVDLALFRIDSPIHHLLIDEFQDTSPPQWRVLEPFTRWALSQGKNGSFWCVGDVKQAIYGWRGGCAAIFDVVQQRIESLQSRSLTTSYRSAQPIIDIVNRIFQNIKEAVKNLGKSGEVSEPTRRAIDDWSQQFEPHTTVKRDTPGYVVMEVSPSDSVTDDSCDETDGAEKPAIRPSLVRAAECVEQWLKQAPGFCIGVLTRTNQAVAETIYELRRRRIAASEEGGNPLTDAAPVTVILSLLQLVDNPGHLPARYHVATSPLGAAIKYTDWRSDEAALDLSQRIRADLCNDGYGPVMRRLVQHILDAVDDREASRLLQFVNAAYEFQSQATLRPAEFVQWIEQRRAADPKSAPVRVMTIHQAKGLEFDIVVLPELDFPLKQRPPYCVVQRKDGTGPVERVCVYRRAELQEILPEAYQKTFAEDEYRRVIESLCLMYVAITRAVHVLHIIVPPRTGNRTWEATPVGLLRMALVENAPLEPKQVVFEHGDARWYRHTVSAKAAESVIVPPTPIRFGRAPEAPLYTSPSRLQGHRRIKATHVLSDDRARALAWGSAMHVLFQYVHWYEDFRYDEPALRRALCTFAYSSGLKLDQDRLLEVFRHALSHPDLQRALSRSSYEAARPWWSSDPDGSRTVRWEVFTERRVLGKWQNQLLSGSIDRLILGRQEGRVLAADILDYKTDSLESDVPAAVQRLVEYYRPQQEAYRALIQELYQLSRAAVRVRLLFVPSGPVVTLE